MIWRRARARRIPIGTPTGKRVLVIGAGPCGLSAAYHLARIGHSVEIHDSVEYTGGMLHFGIPAHVPRQDLMNEIAHMKVVA